MSAVRRVEDQVVRNGGVVQLRAFWEKGPAQIPVGAGLITAAVTATAHLIYVANSIDGTLSVNLNRDQYGGRRCTHSVIQLPTSSLINFWPPRAV